MMEEDQESQVQEDRTALDPLRYLRDGYRKQTNIRFGAWFLSYIVNEPLPP